MILTPDFSRAGETQDALSFWQRLLNEEELQSCGSLEKILVGCEIIAALDGVDLLAA
ncbi:MAG: hypothetical protein ABI674_08455 [Spartobacteria bacterium]